MKKKPAKLTNAQLGAIEEILENMDFQRISVAMYALNWHWATSERPGRPPSLDELRAKLRELLVSLCEDETAIAVRGCGFHCYVFDDGLHAHFSIDTWEAELTDETPSK